ncbi:MAG: DUF2786 domain-containing protein [Rhizobiales bacterium]|nr:DUF2786 domain-containing protein [Hyphomicrobiales bacterium]
MTDAATTRLKAKLRSLLAMTQANGCTEAEALNAAAVAHRLMAEHGVTAEELAQADWVSLRADLGRHGADKVVDRIWYAVAVAAGCAMWTEIGGHRVIVYHGREPDALVAEYLHAVIDRAIRDAKLGFRRSAEYARRRKPTTRAKALQAFTLYFVDHLFERLVNENAARTAARADEAEDHRKSLPIDFQKPRPNKVSDPGKGFADAAGAGARAAHKAAINPGVATGEPARGLARPTPLLPGKKT